MALLSQYLRFETFLIRNIALPLKFFFVLHLASEWTGSVSPTTGPSMLPTLTVSGDIVYTSKRYARGNGIEFGDLIEFKHPMEPAAGVVKRVMGLPGDFVREDGGLGSGDRMIQVVSRRRFTQAWDELTKDGRYRRVIAGYLVTMKRRRETQGLMDRCLWRSLEGKLQQEFGRYRA